MINSIGIRGFRRFEEINLEGLGQINFVLGDNNIGKTSILEAIYTYACGLNILPMVNIPLSRARYSGYSNPYWIMEEILAMVHDRNELPFEMSFSGEVNGKEMTFNHSIFPSEIFSDFDTTYKKYSIDQISKSNMPV